MDTITQQANIVVNQINWSTVGIMIGILMLGGFMYNLWHARQYLPMIGDSSFKFKTLVMENFIRFCYCLVTSFTIAFALNWIPGSAEVIGNLTGFNVTFSAIGLLITGGALAKAIFHPIKREKIE